ncbi:inter-alpha-trypsin inhibitor heavy chain H3 precursor [Rattus norvegicus]|uniref:Inter-alpha-trypsin inhibitor heavy chain H3 n=1 Tax=Rattus norvegicus TaxID=10116 RepID=ITIH3_RAT|nr:inter-alpha-trypsin inhibitor heavy chain H3 precursor [Rattus norvegicus]Q63416.1 RecName: Full=Inter-alpha-trypsin inhibitor heavy chain H3; Short=ITI heavy chain H3; Short=ITI-HC3; Short=Inter-alpha-inhibitor heavy chain 3; Flags: Precursor [Rattus norvegicus]CAA58233.1 pre-alpha-inhibitor, heavy chain 3 [Rattus norvegicus]|eukprot:NP_059047.1 inter-alpha-trypsin inhibitor heavy chain H3 precursor [Rattus norvegicus]
MVTLWWPCLVLALLSGLETSGFPRSPLRLLGKRSLPEGVVDGIEIYSTKISCKVTSRFAHNVVTTRAVNRADKAKEVSFDVELPKTAFITNFTLTIDGVTYPGSVKEKEVAQKQYEKAVSQGKTAGLVKASGRKLEKFTVSVNVAAGSKVIFELTYEELLKRNKGKYEMYLKVQPKQLVRHFEIDAHIFEPQGISMLDADASFITNDLLGSALTKSFSGKKGHVSFKPSLDQQRSCPTCTDSLLNGDFTIVYDVNRESPGNVQIVNGYFVHFFAPQGLPVVPKNIAFVIDVSGSMSGRKIQQTREALLKILDDMKEEDYLNFILFSTGVTTWKDHLVKATPANLEEARAFVKNIRDRSMTNINDGLLRGIEMLNKAREDHLVPERSTSILVMLTDGDANTGESRPEKIQENVRNAIRGKFPLYNLGFGNNLNYNFLESLALENHGFARRIYEDSDASLQLQGFYEEVANPLLTNVELEYPENAILDLTRNSYPHFYDGSEIVVAGRLVDRNVDNFKADVKGHGALNDLTFTEEVDMKEMDAALKEQGYIFGDYIERLWAYLTIEQLLEKRKNARGDEKENITAEALELSLKYHFVTPLTSMVVTKPEDNEDQTAIADKPGEEAISASTAYLTSQQSSHSPYYYVDGDPHFIIQVPGKNDTICFNIDEKPGTVLSLIQDPVTGIAVTGQIIGEKGNNASSRTGKTYFGKLGIANAWMDFRIEVTTEKIILGNGDALSTFSWLDTVTVTQTGLSVTINRKKNMVVSFEDGISFVIVLHQVWKKHPVHQDFLGFYVVDSHRMSAQTHGLLGQFFQPFDFKVFDVRPGSDPMKPDATMVVKSHRLTVTRGSQKDYRKDASVGTKVVCWFVHNNGEGFIDGVHTDYIVPSLF